MGGPYKVILFDFFNTLVLPDASALPRLEIEGRARVSTAALLHARLVEFDPQLKVRQVFHAMEQASRRVKSRRDVTHREIPGIERFRGLVRELRLFSAPRDLPKTLLQCHMEAVKKSYLFPPTHRRVLENLRARHRLAIFSNFDHAPALGEILHREAIADWFDPVVVSESIGHRKPGRKAFEIALKMTRETAAGILFVGDSWEADIAGAAQVGLDSVWLNRKEDALGDGPQPAYQITELEGLLEIPGI